MKKKILIGAFLLLVFATAIFFAAAAVDSYHYDMDPANGVDILQGVGVAILIVLGGLIVLCEIDLFFTIYYFLIKPKTVTKTVFMILSQLLITMVFSSEDLSKFLSQHVSDIFREEIIIFAPIFILYITLRLICVSICFSTKD